MKVWLSDRDEIEGECLSQIHNLSRLPFLHKWIALMPDVHAGKGMPIGGVIATDGVIVPNAVGVDIGCGMAFLQTNIEAKLLADTMTISGSLLQCIIGDILRNVPVGFVHHKDKQECKAIYEALANTEKYKSVEKLVQEMEDGYYQVGTLGGGNHFHNIARELNEKWYSSVPDEYRIAYLPVDTEEGKSYINYMNMALNFAQENRAKTLDKIMELFTRWCERNLSITPEYSNLINCYHNYAALENHYNKNVWIHRKGAIRVRAAR